jgi:hypothetical protein
VHRDEGEVCRVNGEARALIRQRRPHSVAGLCVLVGPDDRAVGNARARARGARRTRGARRGDFVDVAAIHRQVIDEVDGVLRPQNRGVRHQLYPGGGGLRIEVRAVFLVTHHAEAAREGAEDGGNAVAGKTRGGAKRHVMGAGRGAGARGIPEAVCARHPHSVRTAILLAARVRNDGEGGNLARVAAHPRAASGADANAELCRNEVDGVEAVFGRHLRRHVHGVEAAHGRWHIRGLQVR